MKWARIVDGIVDVISFDPDRIWIEDVYEDVPDPDNPDERIRTLVTPGHWNGVTSDWMEVPDNVYGGYTLNPDGTFSPPPPPPAPTQVYNLLVSLLWMAMENEEGDAFDAAMATASPLRLRRAFNAANSMMSDGELFAFVKGVLAGVVGADRAAEIMADPGATTARTQPE